MKGKKHKKVCVTLKYIEHFIISDFVVTGYISISDFDFLLGIPIGITNSTTGLKVCAITAGIKKHVPIVKKKEEQT